MQIGVIAGFDSSAGPEWVANAGRIIEERGLRTIYVPEHVVLFREYASKYPYSRDRRLPAGVGGFLDPFVALGWLAAHTRRVRLGTGICILPQRNPVYTAKQVASVDFLSGGRVDFGIGIGWLREEFDALGVPWRGRAARTQDYVAVLRTLWCDPLSRFSGDYYRLPACVQSPKPVQQPHPPIYVGGESDAALRRAATIGDGWFGFLLTPEELRERLARFDLLLEEAGARRSDRRVIVFPAAQSLDPDAAMPYADAGTDELIYDLGAGDENALQRRADALAKLEC